MFNIVSFFGYDCSPRGEGLYELFMKDGSSRFATEQEILQAKMKMLQSHIYYIAATKLNEKSSEYGDAEKATWGILQQEVINYNNDNNVIGNTLQEAVNNTMGIHTVDSLAVKLTVLKQYQNAVLQARATHIINITTPGTNLDTYDVNVGWPPLV